MDAAGIAAQVGRRVQKPHRKRDFAHGPVVCEISGFGPFWLGIAHLPILGSFPHTGTLADVSVSVGAVLHLLRTRRTCTRSLQTAHK
jgi:hypothetical protein